MDAKLKAEWVAALRSGRYAQGKGALRDPTANTYCCLGVLCDLIPQASWHSVTNPKGQTRLDVQYKGSICSGVLPWTLGRDIFPDSTSPEDPLVFAKTQDANAPARLHLSELNDSGIDFNQIATLIEEQL